MARIDQPTVQRILDAADIVDVVSDYVKLKRRGSGYIGLCPFHNERTPSFSVSKTKGFCKCFSCGKGGSAVGFIMEIEQMTYPEALRLLARKYGIEIEEHEVSEEERERENERASMLAVNDFALSEFERVMRDTDEGRSVGHAYFRERGISDAMIRKFRLGYSLEARDALYRSAMKAGYSEKYLESTGLCVKNEQGMWRDRFRGRVMYPVFTISGKVVAFGGRTLRKDKDVAKYVNSPESAIYSKSRELYGLYQAKQAIVKRDKCYLVEGYMDVISMHQAGVENVVASSGTSLTNGQIRLIHRFTDNVTVIYDSDPAGIKASLRGIDMLLAEGMNIKVLLLPQGDDPDSFAQHHSSSEVEEYIAANETDFISFKTRILLEGVDRDPIARSRVISDIVRSISVIPDQITRTVYIAECSRNLGIDEKVLTLQVAKFMAEKAEHDRLEAAREQNRRAAGLPTQGDGDAYSPAGGGSASVNAAGTSEAQGNHGAQGVQGAQGSENPLSPYEREVLRYAVRYGMLYLGDMPGEDNNSLLTFNVLQFVRNEMAADGIDFTTPAYKLTFDTMTAYAGENYAGDVARFEAQLEERLGQMRAEGEERIKATARDLTEIHRLEKELEAKIEETRAGERFDFDRRYFIKSLTSAPDDTVRAIVTDLAEERHKLSKIHTKYAKIETERDKLNELVPMAYSNLKEAIVEEWSREAKAELQRVCATTPADNERIMELMAKIREYGEMKKDLAFYLGERTVAPRKRR